jgi:hypothetical protein
MFPKPAAVVLWAPYSACLGGYEAGIPQFDVFFLFFDPNFAEIC